MHLPINPPTLIVPDREGLGHAPSWPSAAFLSDEHSGIFDATKHLPGWQDPPDSFKLYEMAFHAGSVILEVGVYGGRSAVIELRGALAGVAARGGPAPQFFGVDVDPFYLERSYPSIDGAGVSQHALLFHGNLARLLGEVPIVPTMVFVDGDHRYPGCWSDLRLLADTLAPGTPVMCHDYGGIPDVRRAVDEWIATGRYTSMGRFAGSILLRVESRDGRSSPGVGRGLSPERFAALREGARARYTSATPPMLRRDAHYTPVKDLTTPARLELLGPSGSRITSGRAEWPYAAAGDPLPPAMPGGVPWPRISIVTPTFNQGRYIEETLLSVRRQGYSNVEHIIIDGGSTDDTLDVIDRYRDGLARVISEKDRGQSDAINKGMRLATGDILTWLNSDDMLAPGALAAVALAFHMGGADLVAGECHVRRDGKPWQRHLTSCDDGPMPIDELLDIESRWLQGQFFYQPEVFFSREAWEKAGASVREDLYFSMDYDLWTRMAAQGARLRVIGRPVSLFRAHDEQKTANNHGGGFRVELPRARDEAVARLDRPLPSPAPAATRDRLRVALFNDLGYAYGAGIAHRRIAAALRLAGHDVSVVAASGSEIHASAARVTSDAIIDRLAAGNPDLVVVGNLHGADLDAEVVGAIAARWPTAILLHDLWWLTGRCAYPGPCAQYLRGCDAACACEAQYPAMDRGLVAAAWEARRRVLAMPNVHLWANSRSTLARARQALTAPGHAGRTPPIDWISFGVELDTFRPRCKADCRERLGLPQDQFIIMSSSSSLADPRKGLTHLAEALKLLDLPDTQVVCVGWFAANEEPPIPGMRAMGYIDDPTRLADLYSAADLFVGPSLEEAFGQVYVEAAACGTPSIGYPVDGKPEAIADGISGRLTARVDPVALADAIGELYSNAPLRRDMGSWARIWAENHWSMSASARRLAVVLRKQGFASRAGIGPKLGLTFDPPAAPEPVLVAPGFPAWRAISGFDAWEGPYPDRNLARCRWARGPVARFSIEAPGGPIRILLAGRNHEPGQRVRLVASGVSLGEREIGPHAADAPDQVLQFDAALPAGPVALELHFWRWKAVGPRPLAMLFTDIVVIEPKPAAGVVEPKPVPQHA
ncbi:MAG: glycosyltransferase [Phycisphaerales bacterium]